MTMEHHEAYNLRHEIYNSHHKINFLIILNAENA